MMSLVVFRVTNQIWERLEIKVRIEFLLPANEDTPQVYAACGRGPRSSMRVLRHGLEVSEMAVSELPGNPNAVWTVKKRADGKS